jgi:hypothetical protein
LLKKSLNKFLKIDPIKIIRNILSDRAIISLIEDANKQQLFKDNEDSKGNKLSYFGRTGYSELYYDLLQGTKENGISFNVGDPYTIDNTGDFYRSLTVRIDNLIEFEADPIKINEEGQKTNLFEAFGEDIIGLNEENLQKLIEIVKDKLIVEIRKQIQ